jgi:hypothetical protein
MTRRDHVAYEWAEARRLLKAWCWVGGLLLAHLRAMLAHGVGR